MPGRPILLLAAAAIVAFAIPASASAAPEVTAGGSKASPGTEIEGISIDTRVTTSIGSIACGAVNFNAQISENTGTTVRAVGIGPAGVSNCFFNGTTEITVDDLTTIVFHSASSGKGTVSLTFEATLPGKLTCHYAGSAVPFTYSATGNSLVIKGGVTTKPAACGTATFEGTYVLTSPAGGIVLH